MDNQFNWTISAMDYIPLYEGLNDYVVGVHWRYQITNGVQSTDIFGLQNFNPNPNPESFIPFDELILPENKHIVIGWLEESMDVEKMEEQLIIALENIVNPPVVTMIDPYGTQSGSVEIIDNNIIAE